MLNIPEQRSRKGKGAGKSESNSFSIEEDGPDEDGPDEDSSDEESSDEDSAPQPKAPPVPAPVAAPTLVDSVLTALTAEPAGAAATAMVNPSLVNPSLVNPSLVNPSLINPAVAASPAVVDASKVLKALPSVVPDLPPARPSAEVDVPVFRRKQTLIGVAAVPDVPLGNLPTGGHGPGLPTRGARPEQPVTFMPPGSATPKFRAPTIGKLADKGDEGDGSGG